MMVAMKDERPVVPVGRSIVRTGEKPKGVGEFSWEDMSIKWAVYEQRAVQRVIDQVEMQVVPVRVIVEFETHRLFGEHIFDAIAFARVDEAEWPKMVVAMAKVTLDSARKEAMN